MLHRIVSEPYYLVHLLVFFSYIPIRLSASHVLVPSRSSLLLHREIQAVLTFLVLAAIKLVKSETWEAFTADFLFYAKVFLAAVALILDYHLALWYALAFLAIYILVQQPPYNKKGTSSQLTPLQLESLLTEGTTSKFWLVEFCALSTPECISTSSFFPELSITYSNKLLSFGTVDLGLFPNAAEKFGISLASLSQLPTYILYERGMEAKRYPEQNFERTSFSPPMTKKILCQHFELDKLLLDYVNDK
ncbi:oxidoreductase [Lithospermum erythrorhizon]|uniref:Oxidoreductase n=1 Tax=Lithospermum erythrorhizon TaxID=34254 RepID=A0AAV3PKP1_LITER